jgi:LmbE family N-acetylglucosaminyl deacetylase
MLTAAERLARQKSRPLLVELHHALSRLTGVLTVMNTGAHPDDEQSGMLALLRFGYGMRVVVACSTRGEGGQNSLGPERGGALGVLRSREMEEAARTLDADVAWLGFGPDDAVHDFGFSKNGIDTLERWGRKRLLERLVRAYRRERPDIVIPTFLDVPGQHGHHRAMTQAAEDAIAMAADPNAFPEHMAEGLAPWRVTKFYLPAWPGGGGTYDDEVPPPNTSLRLNADGREAATGAAFDQIGEWSRGSHATQGMGRWKSVPTASWPLHLKLGPEAGETTITGGLPANLVELADFLPEAPRDLLRVAQKQINAALTAYPARERIVAGLVGAADAIEAALDALKGDAAAAHAHRLRRKLSEIDRALGLAAGIGGVAWAEPSVVAPGGMAELKVWLDGGDATVVPVAGKGVTVGAAVADGAVRSHAVSVAADAAMTTPFTEGFSSLGGNGGLRVELSALIGGRKARWSVDLEEPLIVAPAQSVRLEPDAMILPLGKVAPFAVTAALSGPAAAVTLDAPAGWQTTGLTVTPPAALTAGLYTLPALLGGKPAMRVTPISYPHIGRTQYATPEMLRVLALPLDVPHGRIGYVGGGADRIGLWLGRMGLDVTLLDAADLAGDLSGYSTIVVGIFAFGLRPDLAAATLKLHRWVEAGGHLLTLYHRPSDGWNPQVTPPRPLTIGSPSLRWRVTDPTAAVEVLAPEHKLLTGPNRIGPDDWAGWDKERGLYFAASWDPAYVPLLAMHDRNEAPLTGGLLSAPIGKGRHTHTSLVLHHQVDRLVPGAIRLLANLVQPA